MDRTTRIEGGNTLWVDKSPASLIINREFFGDQLINTSGIADGGTSSLAALGAAAIASGLADGLGSAAGQPGAGANSSGIAAGVSTTSAIPQALGGATWTKHASTSMAPNVGGYWAFVPAGASVDSACIIALHGSGEQGTGSSVDLDKIITQGLAKLINDRIGGASQFPHDAIVIFPQYQGSPLGGYDMQTVINYVKSNFTFDLAKLHLTGYSLGASVITGWWDVGTLSDIASCSIVSTPSSYAPSTANRVVAAHMPTLFIHGSTDTTPTAYSNSTGWVSGLNGLLISPASILDTVDGQGHNIDEIIYDWTSYETIPGYDVIEWHLSIAPPELSNTSGASAGSATASGSPGAAAVVSGLGQGQAVVSGQPGAGANTSGIAEGTSQAEINVGVDIQHTAGTAGGGSSASANPAAGADTAGSSDGFADTQANAQATALVDISGYADGISSASASPQALIIVPQVIALKSRIKPIFSRDSAIEPTINLSSKI